MNSSTAVQPIQPSRARLSLLKLALAAVHNSFTALRQSRLRRVVSRRKRRLRLRETLPLGERRMVALIEFDDQTLLIGVTGNSIALLTPLAPGRTALEMPPKLNGTQCIACGEEQ